jgi:lipopolysaccharide/colanic/teichoic acid biosynthesis glycosyltransferase
MRIDEIPQFFNVLAGSMSMIGPRPERPQFVEEFSKELPEYAGRLAVKPGITGLAQVLANYTTTPENKAKFDLVYIRDYSLLLDLKILFRTVKVVFTKRSRPALQIRIRKRIICWKQLRKAPPQAKSRFNITSLARRCWYCPAP